MSVNAEWLVIGMSDAVNLRTVLVVITIVIAAIVLVVVLVVNPQTAQSQTMCPVSTERLLMNISKVLLYDTDSPKTTKPPMGNDSPITKSPPGNDSPITKSPLGNDSPITKSPLSNDSPLITTIYVITPTYARTTQKVDLTSLCYTFMHVHNLVWIVVEDSEQKTPLVANLLSQCILQYVHLNVITPRNARGRGVEQRNAGLAWLREHCTMDSCNGVVYFADDDNKYDLRLFEMIRPTQVVSVHPVAFAGGLKFEGPLCENGKAVKWHVAWAASRAIPLDMAGFAINLKQLLEKPNVVFGQDLHGDQSRLGYIETDFLENFVTRDTVECRGSTSEVYAWHTKTTDPQLVSEGHHPSDSSMEIR